MTEDNAANPHQWKDAHEPRAIACRQVDAVVAKHFLDQGPPSEPMKVSAATLPRGKAVPFCFVASETFDANHQAAPRLGLAAYSRDRYGAIGPNLNSRCSNSIRERALSRPR